MEPLEIVLTFTSSFATLLLGIVTYFLKGLVASIKDLTGSVGQLKLQVAVIDNEVKHLRKDE